MKKTKIPLGELEYYDLTPWKNFVLEIYSFAKYHVSIENNIFWLPFITSSFQQYVDVM